MNRFYGFTGRFPWAFQAKGATLQGHDGGATSGGSFKRLTGEILFFHPFRLDGVYWDISVGAVYDLQQVGSLAATPTIIKTLAPSLTLTGGNVKNFIPITPPLYIVPGYTYLSIVTAVAVTMRRNATNVVNFTSFSYTAIGYDGGSTTTGSIPVKLSGQYWTIKKI